MFSYLENKLTNEWAKAMTPRFPEESGVPSRPIRVERLDSKIDKFKD